MKRYFLTHEAQEDLHDIQRHLLREADAQVAYSVLQRFRHAFAFLSHHPEAGHMREDITNEPVKFWSVFSYMIVYDPQSRPVHIIRILHASRELSSILG